MGDASVVLYLCTMYKSSFVRTVTLKYFVVLNDFDLSFATLISSQQSLFFGPTYLRFRVKHACLNFASLPQEGFLINDSRMTSGKKIMNLVRSFPTKVHAKKGNTFAAFLKYQTKEIRCCAKAVHLSIPSSPSTFSQFSLLASSFLSNL